MFYLILFALLGIGIWWWIAGAFFFLMFFSAEEDGKPAPVLTVLFIVSLLIALLF